MNLGTKSFRAVASAALGLAMMAGIGTSMVSAEPINVTLAGGTNTCPVSLTTTSFDMGTYTWDNTTHTYVAQSGAGHASVSGTLNATGQPGNRNCSLSISGTDITLGSATAFTASQITFSVQGFSGNMATGVTIPAPNVPMAGYPATGTLTLPGSTSAQVNAGGYSGTITVTGSPVI